MDFALIIFMLLAVTAIVLMLYYYASRERRNNDIVPSKTTSDFDLEPDNSWPNFTKKTELDPALRRIASLIEKANDKHGWDEIYRRTGIRKTAQNPELPLLLELAVPGQIPKVAGIEIPEAYRDEIKKNIKLTHVTARMALDPNEVFRGKPDKLRASVASLMDARAFKRTSLAAPLQPCFEESLSDIAIPAENNTPRQYKGLTLDGNNVVIGIIDDGCSFAHPDFRNGNATRVKYLWHQSKTVAASVDWAEPADFGYGAEIREVGMNNAITAAKTVEEVYTKTGYEMPLASHGTHVMGIATANPGSSIPSEGVACAADIIFVQLPVDAIESGGAVLYNHILDGVLYIFSRASTLGKPAVINISYGGYAGPHDGTTELERAIDQLLDSPDKTDSTSRSVVVAAGNGFEADCHAAGTINTANPNKELHWNIKPEDPTSNTMEIWYNGSAQLQAEITPPDATTPLKAVKLDERHHIVRKSDKVMFGSIDHVQYPGNSDKRITIILGPTEDADFLAGVWKIKLSKEIPSSPDASFHAWIERDASGGRGSARRQQSHFLPENPGTAGATVCTPHPRYTLGSIATGQRTIVVGAYNSATQELSRYTACGPTRASLNHPERPKPDICAPAEGDPAARGILSASSLRSQPTRMNGTSAAAPHVAGAVALMYQYINDANITPKLTAEQIRAKLTLGAATSSALEYNRHQQVDEKRAGRRQADITKSELTGSGKLNIKGALDQLP